MATTSGQADEEGRRRAHHLLDQTDVVRAHRLADQDVAGHADAEDRPQHQHHHDIGVAERGDGGFAQGVADPELVDRAVQRLQGVAAQQGQGKHQQGAGDRPAGQIPPAMRSRRSVPDDGVLR